MTLAIEPMINAGRADVVWLDDDWTVETDDGSLSAHYENTVLITEGEPEILSLLSGRERAMELKKGWMAKSLAGNDRGRLYHHRAGCRNLRFLADGVRYGKADSEKQKAYSRRSVKARMKRELYTVIQEEIGGRYVQSRCN